MSWNNVIPAHLLLDIDNLGNSPNKGKIMENDNLEHIGTVELVSSEVSGHLGPDGKFVYGEPKVEADRAEIFVQTDEDVVGE